MWSWDVIGTVKEGRIWEIMSKWDNIKMAIREAA